MKENNRGRVRFVKFRVSADEYEKIQLAVQNSSMKSLSDYCRLCIRNPQVFDDEYQRQQLKDVIFQLRKIGNNINQIARNINAGSFKGETDRLLTNLERILAVLQKIESSVSQMRDREEDGTWGNNNTVDNNGEDSSWPLQKS